MSASSPRSLANPHALTFALNPRRKDAPPTETPMDPNPARQKVGRYPINGEIARGGMGAVLRGHDPDLGRDLAIKVLLDPVDDPDLVRRFVEEAQIGGQLQHPGIVPVYEIGLYGDSQPYFTMKLVQGRTLAYLLGERDDLARDLPRFLGIFQQVCQTMAYAHDQGVIHRDLKPSNVMVGSFGEVQVMDWGLAKVLRREGGAELNATKPGDIRTVRTRTEGDGSVAGTIAGTPGYMAPEQARGETDRVDTRADVFALGSILCEILTGHAAYEGDQGEDTYSRAVRSDQSRIIRHLDRCRADPQLVKLARKCLEPEPEARPHDAGVVAAEITAYLNGVQERLRQAELERAAAAARAAAEQRGRRLKVVLGGVLTVALLVAAVTGGWAFAQRTRRLSDVEADLTQAETWQAQERWAEARSAVERAGGRLGGSGPSDVQQRVRRLRNDLGMIERLEEVSLLQTKMNDGQFDHDAALPAYAQAFKDFDLDVLTLDVDEAARRLRASTIRAHLLAALDDWLHLLHDAGRSEWRRVLEVVQKADEDEQQRTLRAAWAAHDWPRLRQLAEPKRIAARPPSTALFVSTALLQGEAPLQAIEVLEAAQRAHPGDFWVNHRLAYVLYHRTKRHDEAIGYYRAALALRPRSAGVCVNLSLALERQGQHAAAEDACRKAIELKPDYAEAYANLAYFLRRRGRLAEAEEPLRKARELKPALANVHLNLFYLRHSQDDFDEAEKAIREVVRLEPNNAEAHYEYGVFLAQRDRRADAERQFHAATDLQPNNVRYRVQRGCMLEKLGQLDDAEAELRKAVELDGKNALALTNLGAVLFAQNRHADAEAKHRAAIAADATLALAHLNLGVTLAKQDRLAEAEAALHTAVDLDGDNGYAHFQLGMIQLRQNTNALAAASFREAIRRKFDDLDVRANLGVALSRLGQYATAESEYRQALERGDAPEVQCRLGAVICEQGRFREGLDLIRKGHERGAGKPGWNVPSEQWLKRYRSDAEREDQLPAVLEDREKPADAAEWLEFARLCHLKKQYSGEVKCYQQAFAMNPILATDYRKGHRYNAARAAALAGTGKGVEPLDDGRRSALRLEALTWLRADAAEWSRSIEKATPTVREYIRRSLELIQHDPALAGVRDAAALAKLPAAEREEFRQFWAAIAELSQAVGMK